MSNDSNHCRHEWRNVEGEPYKQCVICCEYAYAMRPAMSNDSNKHPRAAWKFLRLRDGGR